MARRNYRYVQLRCNEGINEEPDLSMPGECASALNVWAPEGRVQTRPGYWPQGQLFTIDGSTNITAGSPVIIQERINSAPTGFTNWTAGSTAIASGSNLVAGDRVYFGVTQDLKDWMALEFDFATTGNTDDDCTVAWSYYNGSVWAPLSARYYPDQNGRINSGGSPFLERGGNSGFDGQILFTMPPDATTTEVNSSGQRYWLRATIIDGTVVGTVDIDLSMTTPDLWGVGNVELSHYDVIELGTGKWHVRGSNGQRGGGVVELSDAMMGDRPAQRTYWLTDVGSTTGVRYFDPDEPGSIAVVPEFNEAFASHFQQRMIEYRDDVDRARVEWRDFAVGDRAFFDRQYIAQESEFPRARYLLNFKGRLWAAGIRGQPHTVRWSGEVPYHRVWPTLSFERLMEDDDSPITGLAALQEQVVVFKRDSIWLMLPVGQNSFGLTEFNPTRIVAGVGCVSNLSIQRVRGRLVFLAEDGIYSFDGTPNIRKVTENSRGADRLVDTLKRVTKVRRPWASAVNWKDQECYLLGVSLDGAERNSHTIVWDYGTNAWWVWDIPAERWFKSESATDDEQIWFVRDDGAVCQLGGRTDNHATISSSVTTQRIRYGDNVRETFRAAEVLATNKTRELSVQVIPDDNEEAFSAAVIDYSDRNEALWSGTVTSGDATAANSTSERRLAKRLGVRTISDHVQLKVTHTQNNQRLKFTHIECGFLPLGRR